MTIYTTNEWKGYGKEYYWNRYDVEGGDIVKYKCRRAKFFDGDENTWEEDEHEVDRWCIEDGNYPDWLNNYI